MTAIAAYLEDLSVLLPRTTRRRILAEVDAHLQEAAALGRAHGADADAAERAAVERFGEAVEVADQFNAVRRRPGAVVRRTLAVALATAATASLGTATVWALEPSGAHPERAHRAHSAAHGQR